MELGNDVRTGLATELRKRGVLTQLSHHAWHPTAVEGRQAAAVPSLAQ